MVHPDEDITQIEGDGGYGRSVGLKIQRHLITRGLIVTASAQIARRFQKTGPLDQQPWFFWDIIRRKMFTLPSEFI
jgi:hypothetical protein